MDGVESRSRADTRQADYDLTLLHDQSRHCDRKGMRVASAAGGRLKSGETTVGRVIASVSPNKAASRAIRQLCEAANRLSLCSVRTGLLCPMTLYQWFLCVASAESSAALVAAALASARIASALAALAVNSARCAVFFASHSSTALGWLGGTPVSLLRRRMCDMATMHEAPLVSTTSLAACPNFFLLNTSPRTVVSQSE